MHLLCKDYLRESGGIRDNVVLNTAVGLLICEKVNNLNEVIYL